MARLGQMEAYFIGLLLLCGWLFPRWRWRTSALPLSSSLQEPEGSLELHRDLVIC